MGHPSMLVHQRGWRGSNFEIRRSSVTHGIAAGAVGAAVVALYFLILDSAAGQPFWTMGALAARLFTGQPLQPGQTLQPILVLGYLVVHAMVFSAFGLVAASELSLGWRRLGGLGWLLLATVLLAALEITFLSYGFLLLDDVLQTPGIRHVSAANLLAAAAMTGYLWQVDRRVRRRPSGRLLS